MTKTTPFERSLNSILKTQRTVYHKNNNCNSNWQGLVEIKLCSFPLHFTYSVPNKYKCQTNSYPLIPLLFGFPSFILYLIGNHFYTTHHFKPVNQARTFRMNVQSKNHLFIYIFICGTSIHNLSNNNK